MAILEKNQAGQKVAFYAEDGAGVAKTGDAGNLSAEISLDGVRIAGAGTWAELDATNHKGVYVYTIDKAETNGDHVVVYPKSATASTIFIPMVASFRTGPDWEDEVLGSGFVQNQDALEFIRADFDVDILPKLRAQASVTEFSGTGWLADLADKIRRWTDEPVTSAKYGPTVLLPMIEEGIRKMFTESLLISDRPILVRYDVTIVKDVMEYVLPPSVAQVWWVAKIDSATGRRTHDLYPTTEWDPASGWRIEGNMFRITAKKWLIDGDVYQVLYVPNGDIRPYKAKLTLTETASVVNEISADGLTVKLTKARLSSTDGTKDTRLNAYGGYMFRILSVLTSSGGAPATPVDNVEQERTIASSTVNAAGDVELVLQRPLTPLVPGVLGEVVTFELVPLYDRMFEDVVAIQVARSMMISDGNERRYKLLTKEYQEKCRAFRAQMWKTQMRTASRFDGRDYENEDYSLVGGFV